MSQYPPQGPGAQPAYGQPSPPYPAPPPPGGYPPPAAPSPPGQAPRQPRQYWVFSALLLAPFSPRLWRDVGQRWRGAGLIYMFLLLLITWALLAVKMQVGFVKFVEHDSHKLVSQLPAITIKDGVASTDAPEPYEIVEPDTGKVFAIIDTTGETTELPEGVMFLLKRDAIVARKSPNELRTLSLKEVKDFYIDANRVNGWLQGGKYWVIPAIGGLLLIFSWIWRIILMLILAVIGLAFASGFSARLTFGGLMRLAAIAMTPMIWLGTLLTLLNVPSPGCVMPLVGIVVTLLYMALVVKANASEAPAPSGGYPMGYPPQPGYPQGGYAQPGYPQQPYPPAGYPPTPPPPGGQAAPGYAPPYPGNPPPPPR